MIKQAQSKQKGFIMLRHRFRIIYNRHCAFSFAFAIKVGLGESAINVGSADTLGPPMGPWALFGSILGTGSFYVDLDRFRLPLGSIGAHLGLTLGIFSANFGPMVVPCLGPSWVQLGPMFGPIVGQTMVVEQTLIVVPGVG
jgi:hypothetical protein